jgi:hypothetical protein
VPLNYKSFYASSETASAPGSLPRLDLDGNDIINSGAWVEGDDYSGSDDDDVYLFEITFVEYQTYDENGKNKYAKINGPSLIGRNGKSPVVLSIDNDNDVIAINADGKIVG